MVAVAVLGLAGSAARAQDADGPPPDFKLGVKLYEAGKYKDAAAAFKKSYDLSPQPQILFAWAQAERMDGGCATAIKLFELLLEEELPEANRKAVETNIVKCKELLAEAEQSPTLAPSDPEPADPQPPSPRAEPPSEQPALGASLPGNRPQSEGRQRWYKDPVGGALLGGGALGVGIGIGFLVSAASADSAKDDAGNYFDFESQRDRAESRGRIGVIATASGVALIGAGVAWYLLRDSSDESASISGWVGNGDAGIALGGRF